MKHKNKSECGVCVAQILEQLILRGWGGCECIKIAIEFHAGIRHYFNDVCQPPLDRHKEDVDFLYGVKVDWVVLDNRDFELIYN